MEAHDHPDRLLIAVDCIVFGVIDGRLSLLLVREKGDGSNRPWSLMGQFLHRNESLDGAAKRVLLELTGLSGMYLEQYRAFGRVDRDPVERTIAVGYYALVDYEQVDRPNTPDYDVRWAPVADLPPLALDHAGMVTAALRRLRYRAIHEPVVFQLLPDRFTLTQLQAAYESIFATDIDAGNFRRRLRKMNYLEQLNEKDQRHSKKGAYYYRYRPDLFERAVANGGGFLLRP